MRIIEFKLSKTLTIFYLFLSLLFSNMALSSEKNTNYINELNTIESYYWIALEEKGNHKLFSKALNKLNALENKIKKITPASSILLKIRGLKEDIRQQLDMSSDTFFGIFPLSRFFNNNFLTNSIAFGTYELFDDYNVMSSNQGVENLLKTLKEKERKQLDVIFISNPLDYALENEALYLFNQSPQFFVHNQKEVNDAFVKNNLNENDISDFKSGNLNEKHLQSFFKSFDTNDLLLVNIEKNPSFLKDAFYVIKGSYFKPDQLKPIKIYRNMGFSRDRTNLLNPIILLNFSFLLVAIILGFILYRKKTNYNPDKNLQFLSILSLSFIISRLSPYIVIPGLNSIISMPPPETLAILSFWYVIIISIIFLFLPFIFIHGLKLKFKKSDYFQLIFSNSGIIGIVFSFGIISWFITSFVIYEGSFQNATQFIIPIIIFSLNFYEFGKNIDKSEIKLSTYFIVLLSILFFMSLVSLNYTYIYITSFLLLVNYALSKLMFNKNQSSFPSNKTNNKLIKWIHPHLKKENLLEIKKTTGIKFTFLKTIDETSGRLLIKQSLKDNFLFVEIECHNENSSFDLINQLLEKKFDGTTNQSIEDTIDSITNFIPFSSLLNMAANQSNQETSLDHILEAASLEFFEKLNNQKNVCILISGLNYLDKESFKWLHQIKNYNTNLNINFIFIGTKLLSNLNFNNTLTLEDLVPEDLINFLKQELNSDPILAEKIIEYLNETDDKTTLNDIELIFQNLKRSNSIYLDTKWHLDINKKIEDNILKDEMISLENTITESLQNFPEYKTFLIISACLGYQFNLKVLSDATGLSLIETAKTIEDISIKTGIIENTPNANNKIKFRNRSTLLSLNSIFSLNETLDNIPLIQRTCCFNAAIAIKNYHKGYSNENERIFNLFEKSGTNNLTYTLDAGLNLSSNLCVLNQFDKANIIIEKCLNYLKHYNSVNKNDLFNQLLIEKYFIELEKSFCNGTIIEKEYLSNIAEKWLEYSNYKNKLIYPIMRTLYNLRDYKGLKSFIEIVKKDNELDKWLVCDIEHYAALIEIQFHKRLDKGKLLLSKCIKNLLYENDNNFLSVKSRIFTTFANHYSSDKNSKDYINESIEIKKQLSDKPGLARSYGSLSRLLFAENPISNETLEATKKWFIINEENKDIFGIIFSRNFLGKIYFNIHKTNQSKDDNLKNSKQQYNENIKLLNNKIDQGSQIQIFTSFADLMEIAKFEKDENTFLDLSSKLYNLLNDFEKIENKFFIDIFKNAFSSKFKNAVYSKQNIKEIFN